jgi:hypothetical protein
VQNVSSYYNILQKPTIPLPLVSYWLSISKQPRNNHLSPDHAIKIWIKDLAKQIEFCDRVCGGRISRTAANIESVTDAVEEIFFAA